MWGREEGGERGFSMNFALPVQLACVAGVVLLLWFLSSPIMSATVTELADSRFARWRDISVVQLEAATV